MVFVKKKHLTETKENNVKEEHKEENEHLKPKFTEKQIKNFKEQAIEVLNILESKGIFIYDPERKPDIYIKKRLGQTTQTNIKKISEIALKNKQQNIDKDSENEDKISDNLLSIMLKKQNK